MCGQNHENMNYWMHTKIDTQKDENPRRFDITNGTMSGTVVLVGILLVLALILASNVVYHELLSRAHDSKSVVTVPRLRSLNVSPRMAIRPVKPPNSSQNAAPGASTDSNKGFSNHGGSNSLISSLSPITQSPTQVNNPIMFGTFLIPPARTPVVFVRSNLCAAVHARLQTSPLFTTATPEEVVGFGLQKAIDYPMTPGHIYFEGYYHSMETSDAVLSRNPRSGKEFQKRAAGDFIRAMFEGFRIVNKPMLDSMRSQLLRSALSRTSNPDDDICGMISRFIGEGRVFGDLSVQIHYGDAVPTEQLAWHSDAENSLIVR
jgi:hypothetical protein